MPITRRLPIGSSFGQYWRANIGVDDQHRWRVEVITLRENTAFLHLNIQSFEITRADTAGLGEVTAAKRSFHLKSYEREQGSA